MMRGVPPVDKISTIKLVKIKNISVVCISWNNTYFCSGSQDHFVEQVTPSPRVCNNLRNCQYILIYSGWWCTKYRLCYCFFYICVKKKTIFNWFGRIKYQTPSLSFYWYDPTWPIRKRLLGQKYPIHMVEFWPNHDRMIQ